MIYNRYAAAIRRRELRERQLVHLIGVGDVQGKPAGEFGVGEVMLLNYGGRYEVRAIEEVSPHFLNLSLVDLDDANLKDNRLTFISSRVKKTRLLAIGRKVENHVAVAVS